MAEPTWKTTVRRVWRTAFPLTGVWRYHRLPHWHADLPFVILWSQKAGSTTVLKWFFDKVGLLDEALSYHPFAHNYEIDVFKKRPGYVADIKRALANPDMDVVKFVRDPAARAFSGYLFLNRGILFDRCDDPAAFWRRRVINFVHGRNAPANSVFSFRDYLRWLQIVRPRDLDGHLAPQYTELERGLGKRLTVYRIEEINAAFAALETRYGLRPSQGEAADRIAKGTHHRPKADDADTLIRIIEEGLPDPRRERLPLPQFDSTIMQAHPEIAALICDVFSASYRAYPYSPEGEPDPSSET